MVKITDRLNNIRFSDILVAFQYSCGPNIVPLLNPGEFNLDFNSQEPYFPANAKHAEV